MSAQSTPPQQSLIQYPCLFPIKVMGVADEQLPAQLADVVRRFAPKFDAATIERRASSGGKYLGLTLTVTATSREQLDSIYRALVAHPGVKVVL